MEEKLVGNAEHLQYVLPKIDQNKFNKVYHSYYSSPETLVKRIQGMKEKDAWHASGWEAGNKQFYGTDKMEQAIDLALNGWNEGVHKTEEMYRKIMVANPLQKKPIRYGVAGAYPNVPRAIAGNPLNMRLPDMARSRRRPVLTLISSMAVPWTITPQRFMNRAAIIASIVDIVESAGYSLDVISTAFSKGEDNKFHFRSTIQVKNSNQPVDLTRLAFGVGHVSMFRRFIFAEKGYDHFNKPLGSGLGYSRGDWFEGNELREKNVYVIPPPDSDVFDDDKADTEGLAFIMDKLKEQGFPPLKDMDHSKYWYEEQREKQEKEEKKKVKKKAS